MVDTDQCNIVTLRADAVQAALALSTEAHWNQNEADWLLFLSQGTVFGIRDRTERLIATAALLPYDAGNAWISMVLVTAPWQRRGLARRLLQACLDAAAKDGLTPWLDATPAGAAVYGPLGFAATSKLHRLGRRDFRNAPKASTSPLRSGTTDELIARDRHAMGFDRRALLTELAQRRNSRIAAHGGAIALVRDGRKARHIGPLLADNATEAAALVSAISASESAPFLLDVVDDDHTLKNALLAAGWAAERPFQRMRFGAGAPAITAAAYAVAGPEYG